MGKKSQSNIQVANAALGAEGILLIVEIVLLVADRLETPIAPEVFQVETIFALFILTAIFLVVNAFMFRKLTIGFEFAIQSLEAKNANLIRSNKNLKRSFRSFRQELSNIGNVRFLGLINFNFGGIKNQVSVAPDIEEE
jgi:hypothetical protein